MAEFVKKKSDLLDEWNCNRECVKMLLTVLPNQQEKVILPEQYTDTKAYMRAKIENYLIYSDDAVSKEEELEELAKWILQTFEPGDFLRTEETGIVVKYYEKKKDYRAAFRMQSLSVGNTMLRISNYAWEITIWELVRLAQLAVKNGRHYYAEKILHYAYDLGEFDKDVMNFEVKYVIWLELMQLYVSEEYQSEKNRKKAFEILQKVLCSLENIHAFWKEERCNKRMGSMYWVFCGQIAKKLELDTDIFVRMALELQNLWLESLNKKLEAIVGCETHEMPVQRFKREVDECEKELNKLLVE